MSYVERIIASDERVHYARATRATRATTSQSQSQSSLWAQPHSEYKLVLVQCKTYGTWDVGDVGGTK